jgi:peptidoglycan hydrolase CwlO-like protein
MLDSIAALFQQYPFLAVPLFLLALFFLFQFVKKMVVRILALAVILLALFVGYVVFVQPRTGLPKVEALQKKADNKITDVKKTVDDVQKLQEKADALQEKRKEALP